MLIEVQVLLGFKNKQIFVYSFTSGSFLEKPRKPVPCNYTSIFKSLAVKWINLFNPTFFLQIKVSHASRVTTAPAMKTVTAWPLTGRALATMTRVSLSTWWRRHVGHVTSMMWTRWVWSRAAVCVRSVARPAAASPRVDWVSAGADILIQIHLNLLSFDDDTCHVYFRSCCDSSYCNEDVPQSSDDVNINFLLNTSNTISKISLSIFVMSVISTFSVCV